MDYQQITSLDQLEGLSGEVTIGWRVERALNGRRSVFIDVPAFLSGHCLDIEGLSADQLRSTCDLVVHAVADMALALCRKFSNHDLAARIEIPHFPGRKSADAREDEREK